MHKKEVQSLHVELQERNETYYEKISDEGFDNLHDYEKNVTSGLMSRLLIAVLILFIFIVFAIALF